MTISYRIKPVNPHAHLFEVSLSVSQPAADGQVFRLPNWIPGSYMIRDFSKNVVQINAYSAGESVALEKIDKSTWQAPAGLQEISLSYRVYAWDLSVRSAHLDANHGFFNGTSVFLAVDQQEWEPVTVEILKPDGDTYQDWAVATSLPSKQVCEQGFGQYQAADYDELIDHPVEMGIFQRIEFEACGVPHEVILTGACHTDGERLAADLKRICEYEIRFFGEPAPMERYVFLVMVVDAGYGGLEHRASTALLVTREHLPLPNDDTTSDRYIEFLGLCSHEYFHTWNVKRIKPAAFVPFQLEAESYSRLLWFFEGITSYYDDLILLRCGLITQQQYFNLISKTITRIQRSLGRHVQTITDSSFDAWNKFYKQDENAPNAIVSYYAKGALVALCLDAQIRQASQDKQSLDELMRLMWARWLETEAGLEEQEPEHLAAQIAGADLSDFFNKALYSTDELPVEASLQYLGAQLHWRARRSLSDAGGGDASSTSSSQVVPWLGANCVGPAGQVKVTHVFNGMAAELAGLAAGDVIVAVNSWVVNDEGIASTLLRYADKPSVSVHYIRLGVLYETQLAITPMPIDTCSVTALSDEPKTADDAWPMASLPESRAGELPS